MSTADVSRRELLKHMRTLSERHFSAAWQDRLEFYLWDAVQGGTTIPRLSVPECGGELAALRNLALDCDGWWISDDEEEGFISMPTWLAMFRAWRRPQ